ncbi:hypothetical protein J3458_005730 [Metarhizium acridum]|uniref:uncharacterized protein n=1 Tax=Metarhizium acridum TaxID=92637 RepID=UPI001C6B7668|nr:hypothetical protein J3458_005730 [Metarhizium acridum]
MKPAAVLVGACIPPLAYANVGLSWKFNDPPQTGLKDVTFPINMAKARHETGYYLAQQFSFKGMKRPGYIGIQPRPDSKGRSIVHAAFSSFQGGTATCHPRCRSGADGGRGVSCAIDVPGDYAHTYNLTVENVRDNTTWRGLLVDTVTKKTHEIGAWTLPSGAGKIRSSQVGFVEYFPWNGHQRICPRQPKIEATFYNPWSNTGGGAGVVAGVHDYGDCKGSENFTSTKVVGGYTVNYGRV